MLWADDQDDMTLHTHICEDSFSLGIVHNRDQAQGPVFSNPTHSRILGQNCAKFHSEQIRTATIRSI